jgi:S1-C subfamily serine protease
VIAMNTAIFSSTGAYSGVGFAVPSNSIMRELPSLIKTGTYQHPWVGISGGKIPSSLAKSMSLSPNYKGVLVASVQSGGPADRAGLKGLIQNDNGDITSIGDIITAIDGHPVRQIDDIINYVEQYKKVGENIKLTVLRNGKTIEMTATLGDRSSTQTATTGASRPQLPFGLGPIPELPQIPGLPQLRLPPLFP